MSTTTAIALIAGCAVVNALIKGGAPLVLGARELPRALQAVVPLLTAPLLAGLVVTQTLADGDRLRAGANLAGVVVAMGLAWRRVPPLACVVAAAVVTGLLRLVS